MEEVRRQRYLQALGVQAWRLRPDTGHDDGPPVAAAAPLPVESGHQDNMVQPPENEATDSTHSVQVGDGLHQLDWEQLRARIAACTLCDLHRGRQNTVFGAGLREARLMVIGEGPGAEEDRRGEAFVGRAGKLLDEMLLAIDCSREQSVFIANIVKCRPPGNRDPRPEEVAACEPYLRRQIDLVRPRVILAVGRVAAQNLLRSDQRLGAMRGRDHEYQGTPVIVTYHPAYLLRSPRDKGKAWQDLKRVRHLLAEVGQ